MAETFFLPARGDVTLVPIWVTAGAPSNGTGGTLANLAKPGDLLVDTTNKVTYQNTNTSASPTWTQLGTGASVAITGGTIDGAVIGGSSPAAVTGTNIVATGFTHASYATGLTAVGSSRTDALALTSQTNRVTTAASSAVGVTLPSAASVGVGGYVDVISDGPSNSFHVYAAGSDTIDGTAGATGVALTNAFMCRYVVNAAGAYVSYRSAVTRSA